MIKGSIFNSKILIGLILIIITISGITIFNVTASKTEKNESVLEIEYLISQGNYNEASAKIDELVNNKRNIEIKILAYKELLIAYNDISLSEDTMKTKSDIEKFKNYYSELLKKDIFNKLKEDLLKKENDIDNYLNEAAKISSLKEKIIEAIEKDIEEASVLIDKFKSEYPNENILDLEEKYEEKIAEIEKEKEDLKETEVTIEEVDYEKDINNSIVAEEDKNGIANTSAAQNSSQIITVVSNGGSYGELVMWEKDSNGKWLEVDRVAARLGQNGMKYAGEVYEMDKCTPTGIYTVTEAFGINANPGSGVPYRELDGTEYWVDDIDSQYYNTMQFGEPDGRWASAEKLTDFTGYYNYSLVIDYNRWPVIPGKSSAIFLHCDMGIYTYGCVAIPQNNLVNLLKWLNPSLNPVIILDFTYEDIYNNY